MEVVPFFLYFYSYPYPTASCRVNNRKINGVRVLSTENVPFYYNYYSLNKKIQRNSQKGASTVRSEL